MPYHNLVTILLPWPPGLARHVISHIVPFGQQIVFSLAPVQQLELMRPLVRTPLPEVLQSVPHEMGSPRSSKALRPCRRASDTGQCMTVEKAACHMSSHLLAFAYMVGSQRVDPCT